MSAALSETPVALYRLNTGKVWEHMGLHQAQAEMDAANRLGDTVQEYATADRQGNPLNVVLHIVPDDATPDPGRVYVTAL